ncbi:MAG TPA: hypothetical protein DEA96_17065 [Leptospiraceae bacterium]|nr:hypothetical protein [Spirochaetaceae bacterium]HBS06682.1 hypothetical protein [Leptospiraceae bacterium]|tara:strand:+ start:453 stop:911 length:459 start_codon:yes stop_codon:yes gene_type:complete
METKHYIQEIRQGHESLGPEALAHLERCSKCKNEYDIFHKIERSVAALPIQAAPSFLRDMILQRVIRPAYQLWHLVMGLIAAIISPMAIVYFDRTYQLQYLGDDALMYTFIMYGMLVPGVIIPLSSMLIRRYRSSLENFSENVDAFLEKHAK